jgi:AraC-like DNA-binding protein
MNVLAYTPKPPLSDFVQLFWHADGPAPAHAKERLFPTGTIELVINLRGDVLSVYDRADNAKRRRFRGAVVCGPQSESFVIDTADQASVMGVHFKPGGAFPFLTLPAGELQDAHVSLDTLWGAKAGRLRERLGEAATPAARFRVLEEALLARATRPLVRHPAVAFALRQFEGGPHLRRVADVTEAVGLSPRRFIQVFKDEVGLAPKLFCRILRFQRVLQLVQRDTPVEWAAVAQGCGYFDQAHFIHDFRAFSGLNPSAYLAHRGEHLNHVPLTD